VRCFTATYVNKKFQHGAFILPTLPLHLAELSKGFQAGSFNSAQMKASIELCINKLSDAAAKPELKANCEKFDSELGEVRTPDGLADSCVSTAMAFWKGTEKLANWSSPYTTRETGVNLPTTGVSFCLASLEECMSSALENDKAK